jgi:hypothetical protein
LSSSPEEGDDHRLGVRSIAGGLASRDAGP